MEVLALPVRLSASKTGELPLAHAVLPCQFCLVPQLPLELPVQVTVTACSLTNPPDSIVIASASHSAKRGWQYFDPCFMAREWR